MRFDTLSLNPNLEKQNNAIRIDVCSYMHGQNRLVYTNSLLEKKKDCDNSSVTRLYSIRKKHKVCGKKSCNWK